jgi:ribosomal protein L19
MNNLEKNYFLFKNKDLILASNKHFLFTKINFSVITLLNFINCIVIDNLMKLDNKTEYNYINYFITEKLIVGDPISVSYNSERNLFSFEGLCIAKRKKKLKSINSSLILRAKINEVGVEVIFFY